METLSHNRSHEGVQGVYSHASQETGTEMTFSVFVPPQAGELGAGAKLPVLWYLSGLTCTHANVTEKGASPMDVDSLVKQQVKEEINALWRGAGKGGKGGR